MVKVRFIPQAWIHDYAIAVDDPRGETVFMVPETDAKDASGNWLPNHSYQSDILRTHRNAPAWVKKWSGPFEIEIEHD